MQGWITKRTPPPSHSVVHYPKAEQSRSNLRKRQIMRHKFFFVFVFFFGLTMKLRDAEEWGSFLRWITFPRFSFCPAAALASFIQEIYFPDQWSQNAMLKKKKKGKDVSMSNKLGLNEKLGMWLNVWHGAEQVVGDWFEWYIGFLTQSVQQSSCNRGLL